MIHHEESCPGAQHRQGQTFFKLRALDRALKQGETFLYPVSLLSPVPTFYACVFLFTDVLRFLQVPRHALLSQDNTIEISKQMKLFFGF